MGSGSKRCRRGSTTINGEFNNGANVEGVKGVYEGSGCCVLTEWDGCVE